MNWWKGLKNKVKTKELLKRHTTFKIGGAARYFIEPQTTNDLKSLLKAAKRYKIPFLILGAGSNILVSDQGIKGIILRLNAPCFKRMILRGRLMEVGSGLGLNQLILTAQRRALSGIEFLAGIPGTVGGALIMNAGVRDKSIGDIVENVTVMDYDGNIRTLNKEDIKFNYRKSNLSEYIILNASIKLFKRSAKEIKDALSRYLDYRRRSQDLSYPSAGCVFKNPPGYSAGHLIDLCGLKGRRIGGACISRKHGNFILNVRNAQAGDVLELMKLAKKEVRRKFNIVLEPEIKIWR